MPYIHRVVEALSIPAIRLAGYEADDIIGTLAHKAERAGYDIVVVTSDKDMFQLLTPHVRIYDPVKDKWIGEAECRERFGVGPARVVEIMGLMGDAFDNIPGVKGIGEKTAAKLIAQFGTIEELLRRVDEVTPARTKAMLVELQAELGKTIVFITHDLNEAMFLGDRIAVMRDGKLVADSTVYKVYQYDSAGQLTHVFEPGVATVAVLTGATPPVDNPAPELIVPT